MVTGPSSGSASEAQSGDAAARIGKDRPKTGITTWQILGAFSLLSSATFTATAFSVVSTKIIALVAGTEGMAIMGLYRNLGGWIAGTLTLGYDTIFFQRISAARTREQTGKIISAAFCLLVLQFLVISFVAVAFAGPLTNWLFGPTNTPGQVRDVRIVLLMAFFNLLFLILMTLIKGQTNFKIVVVVQIAQAAASLLLVYPLLKLGNQGFALYIGAGSLVSSVLGLFFLWKIYRPSLDESSLRQGWRVLREGTSSSLLLSVQIMARLGCLLAVQTMVARHYGMSALGNYSAALLLIDTCTTALGMATRNYLLPTMGLADAQAEKVKVFSRMLSIFLIALTTAGALFICAAPYVIRLFFSSRFTPAIDLLAILSLAFPGIAFAGSCATFLLHKNNMRLYCALDIIGAAVLLAGVFLSIYAGFSLVAIAWAYAFSGLFCGILFTSILVWKHGKVLLSPINSYLGVLSVMILVTAYEISRVRFSILLP